jgi:hypothetical protein
LRKTFQPPTNIAIPVRRVRRKKGWEMTSLADEQLAQVQAGKKKGRPRDRCVSASTHPRLQTVRIYGRTVTDLQLRGV